MTIITRIKTILTDHRKRPSKTLYYEDVRSIQYSINRPLTGRELDVILQMSDEQVYTIKTWLKEAKQ